MQLISLRLKEKKKKEKKERKGYDKRKWTEISYFY